MAVVRGPSTDDRTLYFVPRTSYFVFRTFKY